MKIAQNHKNHKNHEENKAQSEFSSFPLESRGITESPVRLLRTLPQGRSRKAPCVARGIAKSPLRSKGDCRQRSKGDRKKPLA